MKRVIGKYKKGVRHFSRRPNDAFCKATGEQLQSGTINVQLTEQVPFREHFRVAESQVPSMFGWTGDYLFEICRIKGKWGYRVNGGHGPYTAEIMSASRITKDGRELEEGDELLLEFF